LDNSGELLIFQENSGEIRRQLQWLDLSELRKIFIRPDRVDEIQRLLETIKFIVPVGSMKWDPLGNEFVNHNYRWLFLDENNINIASEVYKIFALELLDFIVEISRGKYRLGYFGSTLTESSTFPISYDFPRPVYLWNYRKVIRSNHQSDIDLFIIRNGYSRIKSDKLISSLYERMWALRTSTPWEIAFTIPQRIPIGSAESLRESRVIFKEL